METGDLYTLAQDHQHEVISMPLRESPAFAVEENKKCYIALSNKLTDPEEKTYLAHELGHCEYGGFYNYHSRYATRAKAENKANRWAYIHVLPLPEIQQAMAKGNRTIWELAEYFGVTESFMRDAIDFYTTQLGHRFGS